MAPSIHMILIRSIRLIWMLPNRMNAAIVGCIHPVVLLPKIAFEDDELLGIFVHEISHYTYKHYFYFDMMEPAISISLFKKMI